MDRACWHYRDFQYNKGVILGGCVISCIYGIYIIEQAVYIYIYTYIYMYVYMYILEFLTPWYAHEVCVLGGKKC